MKKIAIMILVLIILSGCAQKEAITPVTPPSTVIEQPKASSDTIESLGNDLYRIKLNLPVTLDGKDLLLTDLDTSISQFRMEIGGEEVVFHGTKETEIASGLEMYVDKIERVSAEEFNLVFHIKKFKLQENEYLLRKDSPIIVSGVEVSVNTANIDSSLRRSIRIIAEGKDTWVYEKNTENFGKLDITNVKTFAKDKSYAILKIVAKA